MAFRHQNIRTSQKGRRPIESDLLDGQLAVNFNEETPGIFFKSDQGDMLKAGPTHIGTEPPTLVKQANYGVGETWFDLNAGIIKIWTGSEWRDTSFPVDSDLKGAPGPKGEPGQKGQRGYDGQLGRKGEKGETGAVSTVPGPQGFKGEPGPEGGEGPRGAKGEVGATGADGAAGTAGEKGATGAVGEKGDTGAEGAAGSQGPKGEKGEIGQTGEKGDAGAKGAAGDKGDVGPTGPQGDKGDLGPAGADGTSVSLNGAVDDLPALNAISGQAEGDLYVVVDDGSGTANVAYVWNGSAWTELGPITGPKGEAGSNGAKGEVGAAGSDGSKGEKGEIGEIGAKGDVGSAGIKGDKGEVGAEGAAGVKGEVGAKGAEGAAGVKGDTGAAGSDGAKGEVGVAGADGAKGDTGAKLEFADLSDADKLELKGEKGQKGDKLEFSDLTTSEAESLKGDPGEKGDSGTPADLSAYVEKSGDAMTGALTVKNAVRDTVGDITIDTTGDLKVGQSVSLPGQPYRFKFGATSFATYTAAGMSPTSGVHLFYNDATLVHNITADGGGWFRGGLKTGGDGTSGQARFQATEDGQVNLRHFLNIEKAGGGVNTLQFKAGDGLFIGDSSVTGETDLQAKNTIALNLDGSATFAGEVVVGDFYTAGSNGSRIRENGEFTVQKDNSTAGVFGVYSGGLAGSNQTVSITAGGSATFAGTVSVGEIELGIQGTKLHNGYVEASNTQGNYNVFLGELAGVETSSIKADGSATFEGSGIFRGTLTVSGTSGSGLYIGDTGEIILNKDGSAKFEGGATTSYVTTRVPTGETDSTWGGVNVLNSTGGISSQLFGDGSAKFAGDLTIGAYDSSSNSGLGSIVGSGGGFYTQLPTTANADGILFQGMYGDDWTSRIQADGSATFAGNVTCGSDADSQFVLSKGYGFAKYNGNQVWFNYGDGGVYISDGADSNLAKIKLKPDGSAEFKGNQHNFGEYVFDSNTAFGMVHEGGSLTTQRTLSTSDTDRAYGHRYGKDITIEFLNNGSASFAGTVTTGDIDISSNTTKGCEVRSDGLVRAQRASGSTSAVFQAWRGTFNSASISADGSATFGGNVRSGSGTYAGPGTAISSAGNIYIQAAANDTSSAVNVVNTSDFANPVVNIRHDGSATFAGTVTVNGSRPLVLNEGEADEIDVKARIEAAVSQLDIDTAINNLIDSAPGTLNTLNEIATALGDDPNLSATLTGLINDNETHIDNVATLSGVAKDSVNLGTFTGVTIGNTATIKDALQSLESSLELKANFLALQEVDLNVDDLVALSGVSENDTDLGTFTGTTITDNSDIKTALQELESAVEVAGGGSIAASNFTWDASIIPDTNAAYDLGSAEYKVRHLFLSDNSIYFGDAEIPLSVNEGDLEFGGIPIMPRTIDNVLTTLGVQSHLDNGAALGAGLVSGDIYYNSTESKLKAVSA